VVVDCDGNHAVGCCGVDGVLPYLNPKLDGEVWETRKCWEGTVLFVFSTRGHFVNICMVVDERKKGIGRENGSGF
jgi:hypothetical protein